MLLVVLAVLASLVLEAVVLVAVERNQIQVCLCQGPQAVLGVLMPQAGEEPVV
jgi:hypothetical protein